MVDKDKVTGSAKKAVPAGRAPRKAPAAKKAVVAKAPAVRAPQPVAAKPAPAPKVAAAVAKPTPPVAAPVPVKAEKAGQACGHQGRGGSAGKDPGPGRDRTSGGPGSGSGSGRCGSDRSTRSQGGTKDRPY
ncbi:hypothetical protein ACFSTD_16130 [Novosphingobium colocasiae]